MSVIEKTIEVGVPRRTAYDQWTQFEEFPAFMEGVEYVHQIDDKRLHWKGEIAGVGHHNGKRHAFLLVPTDAGAGCP